jgi:hypothetical protein
MSDFFKNGIVQGVLATLVGVLILGIFGLLKFKRDEKIVTKFLKNSGVETSHTFRTTHAISSATNLSEERIRNVCSKSSKIRRNQKEKGSWKLF